MNIYLVKYPGTVKNVRTILNTIFVQSYSVSCYFRSCGIIDEHDVQYVVAFNSFILSLLMFVLANIYTRLLLGHSLLFSVPLFSNSY